MLAAAMEIPDANLCIKDNAFERFRMPGRCTTFTTFIVVRSARIVRVSVASVRLQNRLYHSVRVVSLSRFIPAFVFRLLAVR